MPADYRCPQSRVRFGFARRDITPPVGIYHRMWGAAAHDRSEGVHRPLQADAMCLASDGGQPPWIVIAVDHCLLFDREMQTLLERVAAATGLPQSDLVFAFSHTHAAGLMEERRAELPGGELIAPYLEELAAKVSAAIVAALESAEPATIDYVGGHCSLAADRDYYDAAIGEYVCGFNPVAAADDTVLVARVSSHAGALLATIVNYACHPTTLAWENRSISPDFIGALREVVERETAVPCAFLQGASGDLGPRDGFVGDTQVADRNGRQLGFAALAAIESLPKAGTKMTYAGAVVSGATIGTWRNEPLAAADASAAIVFKRDDSTVSLPYRADRPTAQQTRDEMDRWVAEELNARAAGDVPRAADARARAERKARNLTRLEALPAGESFPFPVSVRRIGEAVWVAVEGEPYNRLQRELRSRFPETPIVVVALANGSRVGYLPVRETYGKGIYQESIAYLAPGCLETLIDAFAERIDVVLAAN